MPNVKRAEKKQEVRLDNQLCFALYTASNTVEQHYQTLLKERGLTYSQYLVLMALAEQDGISITSLAKRLELSKATMTPLLRRLENKGFVAREVHKENERQKIITLTSSGMTAWESCNSISQEVFELTGLTKAEANEVIHICSKINRA